MKKSIFLFFAAILCAMNASAWSYKTAANSWKASTSGFTWVTMNSGKSVDVVMLKDVGDGVNICQNDDGSGHTLYCKWTKTSGDIFRGTARWNNGLYSDETVVVPGGKVYIKVGSGTQVQMTAGADYTYTADVTFSNTGESYTISGGTVNGATIEAQNSMPSGGKPASLTMSNSYTSKNSGNVHIVFDLKTNKVTETADSEPEPVADVTVHFINTPKWAAVACHHWVEGGSGTSWPGEVLSKTDEIAGYDVYTATFTGEHTSCIFNNNNKGSQTANLTVKDGKYYALSTDTWYDDKAAAEDALATPLPDETIYFVNNKEWTTINVYAWGGSISDLNSWPGKPVMTKTAEKIGKYEVYSLTATQGSYKNLIFNDGSAQTEDYVWSNGKYYWVGKNDNFEGDTKENAEAALATPVEDVYTVVGADVLLGTAWDLNNADNEMTKQDDGSYVLVKENVDLATTGTYEYKVVKNHSWDWSVPQEGNLTLTGVDVDGTYSVTFTLNKELNALTTSLELVEAKKVIPECYVAGDESLTGQDWNAKSVLMTYDEATEVYTATLTAVPAGTHNMKVVYGGEWLGFDHLATPAPANVKEGEDKKIQFTLAEAGDVTVTYHATNGIGLTGNFAVPVTYDYYIAGTLAGGWSATQQGMTKEGDVYKHTFSALAAGTYEFKITDGQWNSDGDATHEHTTLGAAYEEVSYNEGNIKIVTEEAINLTVIFDATADKITFTGLTEKAPAEKKYYLIGSFNEWTKADATNELTLDGEVYKKEVTFDADVEFKVNDGADAWWGFAYLGGKQYAELSEGNDNNVKMKESKTFTVIFNPAENLITFDALTLVEDYYTIAGATAITGVNWDPANEDNKMTKDGEVYTLTKTGLQLEAGNYEYKVAKNGAWGDGDYPAEGNETVTIAENGVYTIVYTYTVGASLTAVPEKTGEYTPDKPVYTVAGDAALCGTNWKADDTDNDMSDNGDGTFTWTKTDVKITGTVGFKVVKNHDFGNGAYPNDNWNIVPENYEGNAIYTVTITFTESSTDIDVTLTKTGDVTPAVISYVLMGVNGDWDNGIALTQDPGNADQYVLENQVIIKATDAIKVVTLTDGQATAWCGNVDSWSNVTYTGGGEDNIVLEDGIYTFYFKKTANNIYINQTGYARNVTNKYGTICLPYASASTAGATFFEVVGQESGNVYLASVTELEAGVPYIFEKSANQIKVVYTGDKKDAPVNTGANGLIGNFTNDKVVPAGNYILYSNAFIPADGTTNKVNAYRAYLDLSAVTGGKPNQMPGRRYIGMSVQAENETTGVEDIFTTNAPVKVIENGQLIIIRDGVKYNVQGQKL